MKINKTANQIFAQNMRIRRKVLGLSQEKLGELCGLHRTYIGGIEQETRNPSVKNVEKICEVLQIPVSIVFCQDLNKNEDSYGVCKLNGGNYCSKIVGKDKLKKPEIDALNKIVNI